MLGKRALQTAMSNPAMLHCHCRALCGVGGIHRFIRRIHGMPVRKIDEKGFEWDPRLRITVINRALGEQELLTKLERELAHSIELSRIAILGAGSVGRFVAHSLISAGHDGGILLVLRTGGQVGEFYNTGRRIRKQGVQAIDVPTKSENCFLDASLPELCPWSKILNLIVCTKAQDTIPALKRLLKENVIPKEANIVLLQNGLGLLERVKELWPSVEDRPNLIVGVNTHGLTRSAKPFSFEHRGLGTIQLAVVPRDEASGTTDGGEYLEEQHEKYDKAYETEGYEELHEELHDTVEYESSYQTETNDRAYEEANYSQEQSGQEKESSKEKGTKSEKGEVEYSSNYRTREERIEYIMNTLTSNPALVAVEVSYKEILAAQADKMLVNCCINPLTALLDIKNGVIAHSDEIKDLCKLIIFEGTRVIRSLPVMHAHFTDYELRTMYGNVELIWDRVEFVARNTADNVSSMRADLQLGRMTEIDYLNNYMHFQGQKQRLRTPVNRTLALLVKQKAKITFNNDS
ncbi:ketopantoate reductase PanE/ApbA C terminal-domain-containing protein [Lipomyces arxii]|uniref:ketopantoate reductase PanE/ApbA C terminal-domain-containing protein n=1 Tax=Lipomyces arxii TaxID=56418 RepID=UPI0034CD201D